MFYAEFNKAWKKLKDKKAAIQEAMSKMQKMGVKLEENLFDKIAGLIGLKELHQQQNEEMKKLQSKVVELEDFKAKTEFEDNMRMVNSYPNLTPACKKVFKAFLELKHLTTNFDEIIGKFPKALDNMHPNEEAHEMFANQVYKDIKND